MAQVGMHEAKTTLSQLVARAEAGEDIVIARNGKPVARLVPIAASSALVGVRGAWWGRVPSQTTSTRCPTTSPRPSALVEAAARHARGAAVARR